MPFHESHDVRKQRGERLNQTKHSEIYCTSWPVATDLSINAVPGWNATDITRRVLNLENGSKFSYISPRDTPLENGMTGRLFILAVALFVGCSSSSTTAHRIPNDLIIRYAEGGGFTGQWSGAVIAGDGSARAWSPRSTDTVSAMLGKIPASTMDAIWRSIEQGRLLEGTGGGDPGNVTRTIVLSSGGKTVEVRWSYGTTPDAGTQPYAALYEQCRMAVAAANR